MISERIEKMQKLAAERGAEGDRTHFQADLHHAALHLYGHLPKWEKIARSFAYAIENSEIYADPEDRIGGKTYQFRGFAAPVSERDPDLDAENPADAAFLNFCPEGKALFQNQLLGGAAKGHICWDFSPILTLGTDGFKEKIENLLKDAADPKAAEFYQGALILLEAMQNFNDHHIEAYRKIGNASLAERMEKVPRKPAESFLEAVQAFYMQHLAVMLENPFGGNGPGQLDRYLWPYLEKDLEKGAAPSRRPKKSSMSSF